MSGSGDRLRDEFEACFGGLAAIGHDPAGGWTRLAWTDEDRAARSWFSSEAGARGLAVEQDPAGNLWAWWPGPGEPDAGDVRLGASLKMGYFAQQALQLLDADLTVFEQMQQDFPNDTVGVLRNLLGAFQFSGDDIDKKIRSLSGGERTRLVIARMLLDPPNFLVLDEPTNHLDLATKDMLIASLKDSRHDDLRLPRSIVPAWPQQSCARDRRRKGTDPQPLVYPGSYVDTSRGRHEAPGVHN